MKRMTTPIAKRKFRAIPVTFSDVFISGDFISPLRARAKLKHYNFAIVLLSASKVRPSHFVEIESCATTCILPMRWTLSLAQPDAILDRVLPDGNVARQALSVSALRQATRLEAAPLCIFARAAEPESRH